MGSDIEVAVLETLTGPDRSRIEALLSQLSSTASFETDRLQTMIAASGVDLFVARWEGRIVGMATLVAFPLVTGWRGMVEDVVVDHEVRGRGIARVLLTTIIEEADRRGLRTLDLTSRPSREAALALYESIGFKRRETNVLRYLPTTD